MPVAPTRAIVPAAAAAILLACAQPSPAPAAQPPAAPLADAPQTASITTTAADVPRLSPQVPTDLPPNPTQADAVTFAWQMFVAVNWPALHLVRGAADVKKMIGTAGEVVWHTWKAPREIFYDDGRVPPPWEDYGVILPPECRGVASADSYVITRISKAPQNMRHTLLGPAREVAGGTLTDQHGNLAHYDPRVNQALFDEIVKGRYYNIQGQDAASSISFAPGTMEVKAAWREIPPDEPPQIRLRSFRRNATIYTPAYGNQPATCEHAEVGLVGLHITRKTASRPQWVWATFEQVDNTAPFGHPDADHPVPYSFFNPACPPAECVPNKSTQKNGEPTGIPTQVTRVINVGAEAQAANPTWQEALRQAMPGSAFQYYQLIDVQWPQAPDSPPSGSPTPGLLGNTVLETYIPQSSCLNCHYTARTASNRLSSDFSFMLAEAHLASGAAR